MDEQQLTLLFSRSFPFWNQMRAEDRSSLLRSSYQVHFKKGTNIHDGNQCTGIILIRTGSLRLYLLSDEGKEVTLCRLFPGELCVLSASCALDSIAVDIFIDSEENSDCVIVGGCAYEEISSRVPAVKIFTYETALGCFSDIMWVMQQILFMSMDKRLAIFLLDEATKTGSDTIKLTHEQIAKYMGSAREVVSRMLKYFSSEGMIASSRTEGIKLLDKKKLRDLAS